MKNKLNIFALLFGFSFNLYSMYHYSSSERLDWSIEQVNKTREKTVISSLVKIRDRINNLYNIPRMMGKERTEELFRQRVESIKNELNMLVKLNPILNVIDPNLLDTIILVYSKVSNLKFSDDLYLSIKLLNIIISDMSGDEFIVEDFNYGDPSYGSPELEYI